MNTEVFKVYLNLRSISAVNIPVGLILLALQLLSLTSGCSKSPTSSTQYPPPGHMMLLSIEEAGEVYRGRNLISNGDFAAWDGEAKVPEGFTVPKNRALSYILQREDRGGPSKYSADQYWHKSDAARPCFELFHAKAPDIQAGKSYELSVHARSYDNTTASLSVFVLDNTGEAIAVYPSAITVEPGRDEFRKHKCRLRSNQAGTWLVASHANAQTTFRGRIIWLEWRLVETGAAGKTDLTPQALP